MTHGATAEEVRAALGYLLRSTRARPQTSAELAGKLRARGVPDPVAAAALAQARELGAVDDAAFARAWVEDRGRRRGFGAARLRQELRRRQVPDALADDALDALGGCDERAAATDLARGRLRQLPPSLPPEAAARRLAGYLLRRGYPPGLAQGVALAVSGLGRERDWA